MNNERHFHEKKEMRGKQRGADPGPPVVAFETPMCHLSVPQTVCHLIVTSYNISKGRWRWPRLGGQILGCRFAMAFLCSVGWQMPEGHNDKTAQLSRMMRKIHPDIDQDMRSKNASAVGKPLTASLCCKERPARSEAKNKDTKVTKTSKTETPKTETTKTLGFNIEFCSSAWQTVFFVSWIHLIFTKVCGALLTQENTAASGHIS